MEKNIEFLIFHVSRESPIAISMLQHVAQRFSQQEILSMTFLLSGISNVLYEVVVRKSLSPLLMFIVSVIEKHYLK